MRVIQIKICKEARERRTQLMDVAEILFFEEKDYESTTVRDIIERVGLAKGTFYHYFRSKSDLLYAVLERQINDFEEKVNEVAMDPELSTMEKIEKLIDMIFHLRKGNIPDLEKMVVQRDRMIQENFIMIGVERAMPLLSSTLKDGINEGLFDTEHPEEALRFIIAGSSIIADIDGNEPIPLPMLEAIADFAERIMGAKSGTFSRILCKTT